MSQDPLDRATRALKETTEASPEDVRRLRARVLTTVASEDRRSSRRWVWAMPIAAVLAATSALAARAGSVRAIPELVGSLFVAEAPVSAVPVPAPVPVPVPVPVPDPVPVPVPDPVPDPVAAAVTVPVPVPAPERVAVPAPASPPADDPRAAEELAAYRRAHELHFAAQDCARAVPAWDAYLATVPTGALVVEARYNRGICLARIGRVEEARAALRPFAEGNVAGGYRQRESRALLDAIAADAARD